MASNLSLAKLRRATDPGNVSDYTTLSRLGADCADTTTSNSDVSMSMFEVGAVSSITGNAYVDEGSSNESYTLTFTTEKARFSRITGQSGNFAWSGSTPLAPDSSQDYTATFDAPAITTTTPGGTDSLTVKVAVTFAEDGESAGFNSAATNYNTKIEKTIEVVDTYGAAVVCFLPGTKITLADGSTKNIEDLTFDQIRIVGDLKPKVVVCENVKGLTMDYAREYLTRMISEFEKEGYITDYQVLNGWQFGVPQKRERIFIVSIREDVADKIGINFLNFKSMVFPLPSDENKPTIRDAIEDLQDDPENMKEAKVLETAMLNSSKGHWVHGFETHPDFPGSGPCKGLRGVESREKVISVGDNVVGPWFEEQIKNGVIKKEDEKHSYYMSRVVPYDQAAHSLTEKGLQSKFMGGNHFHPEELRIYTLKEAQRIMTLPDDYKHEGSLDDSQARIGLMVAPMCMYHLAESIYQNVLEPYGKN